MSETPRHSNRRAFIANSIQIGAGALLAGAAVEHVAAADQPASLTVQASSAKSGSTQSQALVDFPTLPARVFIEHESGFIPADHRAGARFSSSKAVVQFEEMPDGAAIRVASPHGPLSRVIARWERTLPAGHAFSRRCLGAQLWRSAMALSFSPSGSCRGILPRIMRQPVGPSCWE